MLERNVGLKFEISELKQIPNVYFYTKSTYIHSEDVMEYAFYRIFLRGSTKWTVGQPISMEIYSIFFKYLSNDSFNQ